MVIKLKNIILKFNLFEDLIIKKYKWNQIYTAEEYITLLNTHSKHRLLPDNERMLLLDGIIPVPTKVMFDFICDYIDGELTTSDETSDVIWVPMLRNLNLKSYHQDLFKYIGILFRFLLLKNMKRLILSNLIL